MMFLKGDFATYDTTLGIKAYTDYAAVTDINAAAAAATVRVDSSYSATA